MITNERQYRITSAEADRFQRALERLQASPPGHGDVHPRLIEAEREALESQLQDLRAELAQYEALKQGEVSTIEVDSFDGLALGLIKARIASGLSQKALADRLGLKEQQIQRYEADRYASASYRRLQQVVRALGINIRKEIFLPHPTPTGMPLLLDKLRQVGLKTEFFYSRLLPSPLAAQVQEGAEGTEENQCAVRVGDILTRIFGWTSTELFGAAALPLPRNAAAQARFKMPARRAPASTDLYTAYANYLATILVEGCRGLPQLPPPTDADEMRHAIEAKYGRTTFLTALHFAWDLGVPVLPLKDPGAFHGACWRYEGRNVIVLKQTTESEARWLFDLLHELYHAGQSPASAFRTRVEAAETSTERKNSAEEIAASEFAGDVILAGRAHMLADMCVEAANNSVERLKQTVPVVASREGASVAALANYLAFRLSWQGINWWGTAVNLQGDDPDPWDTARTVFFERFPFAVQTDLDNQLLQRALQ